MIVFAFVQYDASSQDIIHRDTRRVDCRIVEASVAGDDISKISCMAMEIIRTSVVLHTVGIVVTTHARTPLRHVSRLVNVKSVFSIRHTRDTHTLDDDIHSSAVERILKQHTTTSERGGPTFHFFRRSTQKKTERFTCETPGELRVHTV